MKVMIDHASGRSVPFLPAPCRTVLPCGVRDRALVDFDLESDRPKPRAEYLARRAAERRGLIPSRTVSGAVLRDVLSDAAIYAATAIRATATPAGAERDVIDFLRREGDAVQRTLVDPRHSRCDAGGSGLKEQVARLAGAIRAAADQGAPHWLVAHLAGVAPVRHQRHHSRTWEAREPQIHAWRALASAGFSWRRLLGRIEAARWILTRRHPGVRWRRTQIIARLAQGRGVKNTCRTLWWEVHEPTFAALAG